MSDATLAQPEFAPVEQFLALQSAVATGLTSGAPFFASLDAFSGAYGQIQNARLRQWADRFYALAAAAPTSAGVPLASLYLVYRFRAYVKARMDDNTPLPWLSDWWSVFRDGRHWQQGTDDDGRPNWYHVNPYVPPAAPPSWQTAVSSTFNAWKPAPPAAVIKSGQCYGPDLLPFEDGVVARWKDFDTLRNALAPVWQDQTAVVKALLAQPSLTPDEYIFLLHVLLVLGGGPSDSQKVARDIVSAVATSTEYPNDTFGNQLVYLALLRLADPLGGFAYPNVQIQAFLRNMIAVATGADPASAALKTSLSNHLKIAQVDTAYPMHDPYNPCVGFAQRQTDTLFALDEARAAATMGT